MQNHLRNVGMSLIVSVLSAACASGYHYVQPQSIEYQSTSGDSAVTVAYQTSLLSGKYAKRELTSDVYLVALKLTNHSSRDIVFKNNIKVYSGEKELTTMDLNTFYDATQQNPDKSFLFLFLLPLNVYSFSQTTDGNQVTSQHNNFYPIGLIVGPALAFGNRAAAKKANKKFKEELDKNDILEKTIPAGQTATGFIAIRDNSSSELNFKTVF